MDGLQQWLNGETAAHDHRWPHEILPVMMHTMAWFWHPNPCEIRDACANPTLCYCRLARGNQRVHAWLYGNTPLRKFAATSSSSSPLAAEGTAEAARMPPQVVAPRNQGKAHKSDVVKSLRCPG
mmetsp:Transcript_90904/g.175012  ORF Transcript_90904/g.175012 Transcript_90904/m.175012 type:complete len:124 (+) Transcript_90904:214-585(+)